MYIIYTNVLCFVYFSESLKRRIKISSKINLKDYTDINKFYKINKCIYIFIYDIFFFGQNVKEFFHVFVDLRRSSRARNGWRETDSDIQTLLQSRWYSSIAWTDACVGVSSYGNPGMQGTACECVLITLLSLHPAVFRIFYIGHPGISLPSSLFLYSCLTSALESYLRPKRGSFSLYFLN